jgi:glycosyltransferase involved in cell wall biosynthesis
MKHQDANIEIPIKLLVFVEATTVTGAAKNVLDFCLGSRELKHQSPDATITDSSIVTFVRGLRSGRASRGGPVVHDEPERSSTTKSPNEFIATARKLNLNVDVIEESFAFDPSVLIKLRNIVSARAPDIILTHNLKSHFLVWLSRLWRQYPWVAFHHGYTTTDLKMLAYNQLNRLSLPAAHRVITVCGPFARELERSGVSPKRIHVQHNSIRPCPTADAEAAYGLRATLGIGAEESVVLAVGRLSREKGHCDLISAFGLLRKNYPQLRVRLVVVGDGPERSRIQALITSLGLDRCVLLAGQQSDVKVYYAMADVLALSSHSEGSPYVLLEAMAAGLPVIATSVGGVPEMVAHNETAWLVPPRNPPAMADALHLLLTDRHLSEKISARASALIATRYLPEKYVRALNGVYAELMLAKAGPYR